MKYLTFDVPVENRYDYSEYWFNPETENLSEEEFRIDCCKREIHNTIYGFDREKIEGQVKRLETLKNTLTYYLKPMIEREYVETDSLQEQNI